MGRPFRGRLSRRDRILASNAAISFYVGASPRQDAQDNLQKLLQPVPPLRHKVKRPVDGKPVVPLEKEIQKTIIAALELRRDVVFAGRFNRGQAVATYNGETRYTPFNSVKGFPDIHGLLVGGRAFYIEVKRPAPLYEEPTEDQQDFLDAARVAGAVAGVATSVEEAMALLPCMSPHANR